MILLMLVHCSEEFTTEENIEILSIKNLTTPQSCSLTFLHKLFQKLSVKGGLFEWDAGKYFLQCLILDVENEELVLSKNIKILKR